GEPPPREHLLAQDLCPEVFDLLVLGEEAVAADVEAVAVVLDRARDPAHVVVVLLQHRGGQAAARQLVSGGQPGRSATQDHDLVAVVVVSHRARTMIAALYFLLGPMHAQPVRWAALERPSFRLSTEALTRLAGIRRAVALAFIPYAVSRLAMGIAAWAANATLPYGRPQDARYPAAVPAWLAWDAQHYLHLARAGYPPSHEVNAGFFPLLPLLLHAVGAGVAAALLLSLLAGLAGLAVLTGLTLELYGEQVA